MRCGVIGKGGSGIGSSNWAEVEKVLVESAMMSHKQTTSYHNNLYKKFGLTNLTS